MRKAIQFVGLFLLVAGISGTIDHLFVQPLMSVVLNVFNRFVIPNIDALAGYELYANLSVAAVGAVIVVVAEKVHA
ncbi:hypothetical protein [Actinophytocola sp.]|jgi:hypothetical protein|uniref:hypothetical protein n=1 Tax=Actinophytocola sp. TaxID=1872138 RepID=UPI002ED8C99A